MDISFYSFFMGNTFDFKNGHLQRRSNISPAPLIPPAPKRPVPSSCPPLPHSIHHSILPVSPPSDLLWYLPSSPVARHKPTATSNKKRERLTNKTLRWQKPRWKPPSMHAGDSKHQSLGGKKGENKHGSGALPPAVCMLLMVKKCSLPERRRRLYFFPFAFVAVNKKKIVFQPLSFDLASVCTRHNGSPVVSADKEQKGKRERARKRKRSRYSRRS